MSEKRGSDSGGAIRVSMDEPVARLTCAFERAVLSRKCGCRHAQRLRAGNRQAVQCRSQDGHADCVQALGHIRQGANFAFGSVRVPSALPNVQALSLECGGLTGLQNALDNVAQHPRVDDIYSLIQRALRRYGSIEEFPRQEIIRGIATHKK